MVVGASLVGVVVAVFVGTNIGGSSTGTSYGPSVGSGVISMRRAGVLMTISVLAGGLLAGRRVVETLGTEFVPPEYFTLEVSLAVLVFTGCGILFGNLRGVPVSTSETIISAITGMGIALGVLDWATFGQVVIWWVFSPVIAFWLTAVIGRYFYDDVVDALALQDGSRTAFARVLVIGLACYMAFSAGASNVANAIAPLVGAGVFPLVPAIVLGGLAMGAGAFVFGPRTMKTVGNDITDLPLEAALIVEAVAATIITLLSLAGIPASLAITAITCVIGLGWGGRPDTSPDCSSSD
jgi:PiT family inorganic phosphate transporter